MRLALELGYRQSRVQSLTLGGSLSFTQVTFGPGLGWHQSRSCGPRRSRLRPQATFGDAALAQIAIGFSVGPETLLTVTCAWYSVGDGDRSRVFVNLRLILRHFPLATAAATAWPAGLRRARGPSPVDPTCAGHPDSLVCDDITCVCLRLQERGPRRTALCADLAAVQARGPSRIRRRARRRRDARLRVTPRAIDPLPLTPSRARRRAGSTDRATRDARPLSALTRRPVARGRRGVFAVDDVRHFDDELLHEGVGLRDRRRHVAPARSVCPRALAVADTQPKDRSSLRSRRTPSSSPAAARIHRSPVARPRASRRALHRCSPGIQECPRCRRVCSRRYGRQGRRQRFVNRPPVSTRPRHRTAACAARTSVRAERSGSRELSARRRHQGAGSPSCIRTRRGRTRPPRAARATVATACAGRRRSRGAIVCE